MDQNELTHPRHIFASMLKQRMNAFAHAQAWQSKSKLWLFNELIKESEQWQKEWAALGVQFDANSNSHNSSDFKNFVAPLAVFLPLGHESGPLVLLTAVLSGIPYAPIDPTIPAARLSAMLQQLKPQGIWIADHLNEWMIQCSQNADHPLFSWQQHAVEKAKLVFWKPLNQTSALNKDSSIPTYIIHTSGSTGTPKGVAVGAQVLHRLLDWHGEQPRLKKPARTLGFTLFSFDVHFQEVFATWWTGGTLISMPEELRRQPDQMLTFMEEHRVERLYLPFAALNQLARVFKPTIRSYLIDVITAGEALIVSDALRQWFKTTSARLHNHYGPSETHVITALTLNENPEQWEAVPSIGTALPHVIWTLIDAPPEANNFTDTEFWQKAHTSAMTQQEGELWVAGECLADDYWQNSLLTGERFPSVDLGQGVQRWYRTGDWVKNENSELRFAGRKDQQIKIRGHRVETAEIESVILNSPLVAAAVVTAHGQPTELIAHWIPKFVESEREQYWQALAQGWQSVWTSTYQGQRESAEQSEPCWIPWFLANPSEQTIRGHFRGWISSETHRAIPENDMIAWLIGTLENFQLQKTTSLGRVVELGAGNGLIGLQLLPLASHYLATDVADSALQEMTIFEQQTRQQNPDLTFGALKVRTGAALEILQSLPSASIDTVVLNSVTQHFPDAHYFNRVLQEAARCLTPNGRCLFGDITQSTLRLAFFAGLTCISADINQDAAQLAQTALRQWMTDSVFSCSPAYLFHAVKQDLSWSHVEVRRKRGKYLNELVRHRFDAVLIRQSNAHVVDDLPVILHSVQDSQNFINNSQAYDLAQSNIHIFPVEEKRLLTDFNALTLCMTERAPHSTVASEMIDWRRNRLSSVQSLATISCSGWRIDYIPAESEPRTWLVISPEYESPAHVWRAFGEWFIEHSGEGETSHPERQWIATTQHAKVVHHIEQHLPEYQRPARWMAVNQLLMTATGKYQRRLLPLPTRQRPALAHPLIPASCGMEQNIVNVWQQLLQLDAVGVTDPFFDVGGHSLLAVDLALALSESLKQNIAVVHIFQHPTIRAFAASLQANTTILTAEVLTGTDSPPEHFLSENQGNKQRNAFSRFRKGNR
ncbi:MAG: AMP-binding protein [Pseudomonadota bacterium]